MDIGRAYTYITSDPKWIAKILIAAAVSVVPILNLALNGYGLEVLRRVFHGQELPLPEWDDFGDYFVKGLLLAVGLVIWQLPLIILVAAIIIAGTATDSAVTWIVGLVCLLPLVVLAMAIVVQVVIARYAVSGDFGSMFEFGAILRDSRRGAGTLLLCALVYIVAAVAFAIAGVLTCGIGFFFITPWLTLAQAHLLGQAYRGMQHLPSTPSAAF